MLQLLETVVSNPSGWDSRANYVGQSAFPGWYCVVTQNRDSDTLTRSNFRSALKTLGGESDTVAVHRFGHWACGWWEALAVQSGTPAFTIAEGIAEALDNYPVVDESDWSELETEEANQVWRDCYTVPERIAYIRKASPGEFEFRSWSDLRGCIRGDYFGGYASELLN